MLHILAIKLQYSTCYQKVDINELKIIEDLDIVSQSKVNLDTCRRMKIISTLVVGGKPNYTRAVQKQV